MSIFALVISSVAVISSSGEVASNTAINLCWELLFHLSFKEGGIMIFAFPFSSVIVFADQVFGRVAIQIYIATTCVAMA